MKITPVTKKGFVTKVRIEIDDQDAIYMGAVLSYARSAGGDDTPDGKKTQKILEQLAAACDTLNMDSQHHVEPGRSYHAMMKKLDPSYEIPS